MNILGDFKTKCLQSNIQLSSCNPRQLSRQFLSTFIINQISSHIINKIYLLRMQNLLEASRRTANINESPVKLSNISPEKYGKGAFCDLAYTPSKLADNFLYRDVTTLKKIEQGNGKLRQTEALKSLFQDRLEQLREERDGIQKSLNSQIQMYKKLLMECEAKNQARIRQIQTGFKIEIKRLLDEKEQDAKYAQSQKELLQNRIQELQSLLAQLKDKYDDQGKQYDNLRNEKQKLDISYHNACKKITQLQKKNAEGAEEAKDKIEDLNRQIFTNNANHKKQLQDTINSKNKEIENVERLHRTELEKLENKRAAENLMKNQQLKDITNAFEAQGKRLNQIVNMKQRIIENLNKDLNKQKQRVLELTRSYENEINNLNHEKSRLLEEVDDLNRQNTGLNLKLNDLATIAQKDKLSLENYIRSLKDDLEINQVNYIRQKDRNCFIAGDLQKQITLLRTENLGLKGLSNENQILAREVRNLRELLLESSHQMQKCKEEFIRMGKQRDILILKLRDLGYENETLHRIKVDREQQARGWKDTYYMSKNRY